MIRCQTKVLLYWLQVSLRPDCKNFGSGVPSLMAADKPCPQLQPSLLLEQFFFTVGQNNFGKQNTVCKNKKIISIFVFQVGDCDVTICKVSESIIQLRLDFTTVITRRFDSKFPHFCKSNTKFELLYKDRKALRTLVESLVQMTSFISRIFLKLVELQIRLFCWNYAFYIITFQKIRQINALIRLFCWNRHFKL